MASICCLVLILTLSVLLVSPSYSLTCNSQKFSNNRTFTNCSNLPVLNAQLHFTYNASNSSLSIAFVAPPAKPDGWVAWAINPTSTGMVGSQALLAFKSNDKLIIKTYNIEAYGPLMESKLSFDVWDLSAESYGEKFVIFGSVKVPEKAMKVNQVWQVGSSVTNGSPNIHATAPANTESKGVLELLAAQNPKASPSPSPGPAPRPSGQNSVAPRIGTWNAAFFMGLFVLLGSLVVF